jgi:hydroxymethylbilane synthase
LTIGTRRIVIGTRGSRLALAQTAWVVDRLRGPAVAAGIRLEIVTLSTEGDRSQAPEIPLPAIAGRGVFVKELEWALSRSAIDIAVHSLKDMTVAPSEDLAVAAIPERADPRDVLVSRSGLLLAALPAGAMVGTGSPRRVAQLALLRPDLAFEGIRGNVDTRIGKVDAGSYDAVVLAAAGLDRLGLAGRITETFDTDVCTPDPGQGALAVEVRRNDLTCAALVAALDHPPTRAAVTAERAVLTALGGGCLTPVGAYATIGSGFLHLLAALVNPEGRRVTAAVAGPERDAEALGHRAAEILMAAGGD